MGIFSNKMLLGLAGGAAALSLVGVGAGASFTQTSTASGQINTGHVALQFTSVSATYTSNGGSPTSWTAENGSYPTSALVMKPTGPVGSHFTADWMGVVENTGNVTPGAVQISVGGFSGSSTGCTGQTLESETYVTSLRIDGADFTSYLPNGGSTTLCSLSNHPVQITNQSLLQQYFYAAADNNGSAATASVELTLSSPGGQSASYIDNGGYSSTLSNSTLDPTFSVESFG